MNIACDICSGTMFFTGFRLFDDRYGFPGEFRLFACGSCRHMFVTADSPPPDPSELYTRYYPRSTFAAEQEKPRETRDGFLSWLNGDKSAAYTLVPRNARILDIGCGFGESIAYHTARGCDAYGVEVDENVRRVAEKYGYKIRIGSFDAVDYPRDFFDYVTMDQVIEHLRDPMKAIRDIAIVLKPGGIAIIGTPNSSGWGAKIFGKRWINWHVPYHVQYFSVISMKMAAEQAGLVLDGWKTITNSNWLHYQWMHLLAYPEIGTPSAFWSPDPGEGLPARIGHMGVEALRITRLNHAITRMLDCLGRGDNYIFILRKK